jgi:hypothetical protein
MIDPGITIDTLNLRLPQGFAERADAIARRVGKELARLPVQRDVNLTVLQLPSINVNGGESDGVIARRIARAIHRQINNTPVKTGSSDQGNT